MKSFKSISYLLVTIMAFLMAAGCVTVKREPEPTTTTTYTERVITTLPTGYTTRVYGGTTYYTYGNVIYRTAPGGYTVVPQPW